MNVNKIEQASLMLPVTNNSNTQVKQTQNGQEQLQDETAKLTQDTYHKAEQQEPDSVYDKMVITTNTRKEGSHVTYEERMEEENKNYAKMSQNLYFGTVPDITRKMVTPYEELMAELTNESPELAEKSFGISVNKQGELEASGKSLNNVEKSQLNAKLNENEKFVKLAQDFKDNFLEHVDLTTRGWGKYDISDENFAEVFDFKSILESAKDDPLLLAEGGLLLSYMSNVSSQLKSNANVKDGYSSNRIANGVF